MTSGGSQGLSMAAATNLTNARAFFDACEVGKGWAGCAQYCTPDASFSAQAEPLKDVKTLEGYTNWMKMIATEGMPGCTYEVHTQTYDELNAKAIFFATIYGKPKGTETMMKAEYVYICHMNAAGKVDNMVKVWNPAGMEPASKM